MHCLLYFTLFVGFTAVSDGAEPIKPPPNSLPFLVYFESRHRGLCEGFLISRTAVMTGAVCVINSASDEYDTGPITVVLAAQYRHPNKGIKIPVSRIIIPKLPKGTGQKGYLIQKSPAILLLKKSVPDGLAEFPQRGIEVDYMGKDDIALGEECLTAGWHFFYQHDTVYPVHKFLLQRNVRLQFLAVEHKNRWCGALVIKMKTALESLGYEGYYDSSASLCLKDGMYGAPLICKGKVVAMLSAPDAQWTNCTGKTVMFHKIYNPKLTKRFLECVSGLFKPEFKLDMEKVKNPHHNQDPDYLNDIYDNIIGGIGPLEDDSSWDK